MTNFNEYFENKKMNEGYEDNNGVVYNDSESEIERGIEKNNVLSDAFLTIKRTQLLKRKKFYEQQINEFDKNATMRLTFRIALTQIEDSIEIIDYLSKNK